MSNTAAIRKKEEFKSMVDMGKRGSRFKGIEDDDRGVGLPHEEFVVLNDCKLKTKV